MPKSILQEAEALVNGDRQKQYGNPISNWTQTAEIASAMLGIKLTARDCVMFIIAVKLARLRYKYKRDTTRDISGYLEILSRIVEDK